MWPILVMWRLNSFTVWWDDRGVANKPAPALPLRDGDQVILEKVVRSSATTAGAAQRARIVLLASRGVANALISELVGVSRPTVNLWRDRYLEHGLGGLTSHARADRRWLMMQGSSPQRPGLPRSVWGWLTGRVGCWLPGWGCISPRSPRPGRSTGVRLWEADTFTFSTDPELEAMVTDVVGLYLSLLVDVIVLCVDEKSQIQALDRT